MNRWLLALALVITAGGSGGGPDMSSRAITFVTGDGVTIHATVYPAANPNPPGLILVPMLGASRDTWNRFALTAQANGYQCIAIDVRGHGESTLKQGEKISHRTFTAPDWLNTAQDIAAAKQALIESGADPKNIAIAGASIGGNLALQYAVEDAQMQAVVMLSPGLDYRGVGSEAPMRAMSSRPVLLLTGVDDAYSAETCRALKPLAQGHCEIREYDGAAHGTDILDAHPMSADQILLWLSAIIGPEGGV